MQMLAVLALVLALTACAGYRLGSTGPYVPGTHSAEIRSFDNQTPEPALSEALSQALRKQIHDDGNFTLETRQQGDIIIDGVITEYQRNGLTFQPQDILTARDFEVTIKAKITAIHRTNGKVFVEGNVSGRTLVRGASNLVEAERRALPLLMRDLAFKISDLLLSEDW
ncbi:MAG: LPS assembly lipoprotein LptE [Verrucomicrobiota bacterium]|nr:LPS assembly lipoprotein LptE [Verrucomicrobiota bacterium]